MSAPGHLLVQWHVTDRCNLRCAHCYQGETTVDPPWDAWMALLDRIEAGFAAMRARRGAAPFGAHVTVTGGEPFVRRDFLSLLERLSAGRSNYSFGVLTNGTLIDANVARTLRRLGARFVQVSIEGTPETHDRIRGRGSHACAARAVAELVRARVPAHISFTAHRANYREFPAVAELGRSLGAARVWTDRLVPIGRAGQLCANPLTPAETREFVALMAAARGTWLRRAPVSLHRALQFAAAGTRPYRCTAGRTLLAVLAGGEVCPCRRLPIAVGNLHDTPLETLYDRSPVLQSLRRTGGPAPGCARCFYAEACAGGLRCLSHAVYGTPFRADPGCWMADAGEARPHAPCASLGAAFPAGRSHA